MEILDITETDFDLTPFRVKGNNWVTDVRVDVTLYDSVDAILMEAATLGVEKFIEGDFVRINSEKPVGYGAVILVANEEINSAVRTDVVLANAAQHEDAKEIKKLINKRKRNG
jgi:hypothetical protein